MRDGSSIEAVAWNTARLANLCVRGSSVRGRRTSEGGRRARETDDAPHGVGGHLLGPHPRLVSLVAAVARHVGPRDAVRGRDNLGGDDGAERLADVGRVCAVRAGSAQGLTREGEGAHRRGSGTR